MMGIPNQNDAHIYLLYNKYNDNNLDHWRCAGPIFGYKATPKNQEWSGSATVNKDGSIQLFYTDVDTREGTNHQKISTVNLNLRLIRRKIRLPLLREAIVMFFLKVMVNITKLISNGKIKIKVQIILPCVMHTLSQ